MPRFSAAAMYIAQMTAAGELIVIEVVISPSGRPSSRISMSAQGGDADAALAELAQRLRGVGVVAVERGHVEGDGEAGCSPARAGSWKRAFVSSALPKPANMRIVQSLPR